MGKIHPHPPFYNRKMTRYFSLFPPPRDHGSPSPPTPIPPLPLPRPASNPSPLLPASLPHSQPLHQLRRLQPQSPGQGINHRHLKISLPPLDKGNFPGIDPRPGRQFIDRQPLLFA